MNKSVIWFTMYFIDIWNNFTIVEAIIHIVNMDQLLWT